MRAFGTVVFAMIGLAACPGHESGAKNGKDGVLYFTGVTSGDFGAVPVGYVSQVTVSRHTSGVEICKPSLAPHGAPECSGGSEQVPIVIESAACEGLGCTIEIDAEKSTLRFSSGAPGATLLRVRAKSKEDGEIYSDAFAVRFADATRLELLHEPYALLAVSLPVYPELVFPAPRARLVDAEGRALKTDYDAIPAVLEGTAIEESTPGYYRAVAPGAAKLTWDFRGLLRRSIDVEVVAPGQEQSLVILPSVKRHVSSGAGDERVELDAFRAELDRIATVDEVGRPAKPDNHEYYHPVLAVLEGGRRALVPIDEAVMTPAEGAGVSLKPAAWTVQPYPVGAPDATMRVRAGKASREVAARFR